MIPVAILTSDTFDAADVDLDTVSFEGAAPVHWTLNDVDGDGDIDMKLHFRVQQVGISPNADEACLECSTYGGEDFAACDSVRIVPWNSKVDSDADGYTDAMELCVDTDIYDDCPDDLSDDAWPPDTNHDKKVDVLDMILFGPPMSGPYDWRYDFNNDGEVNLTDIDVYTTAHGTVCEIADADGDTIPDRDDPDDDNDAYSDIVEVNIGTDPLDDCPDDPSDHAWPPDINNDGAVNVLDIMRYREPLHGPYDRRYDLNADGSVNILDVMQYRDWINATCTNS